MSDFIDEAGGMSSALLVICLIIVGVPVFMGLLFKLFVSMWGL